MREINGQTLEELLDAMQGFIEEELKEFRLPVKRAEDYGAQVPEGVVAITCGVDTQDNRFEYEIVG